jgi:hypothetical protein
VVSIVGWRIAITSPPVPSSGSVSCTKSLIKVDLPVHRGEESMRVSDIKIRQETEEDKSWFRVGREGQVHKETCLYSATV